MSEISINNVINISVSEPGKGLGQLNTSSLAIITDESFADGSFILDNYKIYLSPSEVATDFGSGSLTYKQAVAIFSQNKNILSGNGYLIVFPKINNQIEFDFNVAPVVGAYDIDFGSLGTIDNIPFDKYNDINYLNGRLKSVVGISNFYFTESSDPLKLRLVVIGKGAPLVLPTIANNTLTDGTNPVTVTPSEAVGAETTQDAYLRSIGTVNYFGLLLQEAWIFDDIKAIGTDLQSRDKILFTAFNDKAMFALADDGPVEIAGLNLSRTRQLLYNGTVEEAILFASSYASRALSTNFSAINSTQTMHLKDLSGVSGDSGIDESTLAKMEEYGIDGYPIIQGVPKVFSTGFNKFFDQVYNLSWFKNAIQIAGFNVLAQTQTKIPQTEDGIAQMANAYRRICEQAITNNFVGAGEWNSPDTFGNLEDFKANIRERGYYIYTQPVALQPPLDREQRKAPIAQIAIKETGATHSADIIINVNA